MTTREEWQAVIGKTWADNYRLTDRAFAGLTQRLLERIAEHPGHAVLDIGCGAGELALAIARARAGSQVLGVDVSADLVAAAQTRGESLGNVRFVEADAASWHDEAFAPDLLISRHGVMFFDDPVDAFAQIRATAKEGAALVCSCFRSPGENPWASDIARLLALPPTSDPRAPGPFAFADPGYVEDVLARAGWSAIGFEPVDFAYVAGTGEDPVEDAMQVFRRIGPAAAALRLLDGEAREQAEGWLRGWIEDHRSGNLVAFPAAAWIVSAHN
jgi:SAM-dependent methyltransferase